MDYSRHSAKINRPNPALWHGHSVKQVFVTVLERTSPSSGPALTMTSSIPDLDHYKGSFGGRVFPLWNNREATQPNMPPKLLPFISGKYSFDVSTEDLIAYIAAISAHPAYTARFQPDLSTPGLRIPLTADATLFKQAAELGYRVVWLHTFGERMADASQDRPPGPPRLLPELRPTIPAAGTIPQDSECMPDSIGYDASKKRLLIGTGYVDNVEPAIWNYEVSGKQILVQWFSYRKADRDRPIIGDRRPPSPLGNIQPDRWLAEYTTELLNVLNVLGLLVELEPAQAKLLEKICGDGLITEAKLRAAGVLEVAEVTNKQQRDTSTSDLFEVSSD